MAPKENCYVTSIPQFYRLSTIQHLMFAHVRCLLREQDITVKDAVRDYLETYEIPEIDFDIDTATTTYHRMQKMFFKVENDVRCPADKKISNQRF